MSYLDQVVQAAVEIELANHPTKQPPGPRLFEQKRREMTPLAQQVTTEHPGAPLAAHAAAVAARYRGEPITPALADELNPQRRNCSTCQGQGVLFEQVPDSRGGGTSVSPCPDCTPAQGLQRPPAALYGP